MSIVTNTARVSRQTPGAEPPADHPARTFCTSEQMDLWRQVFAEADHRAAQKPARFDEASVDLSGTRRCGASRRANSIVG
jgi:hypothetical protein